MGFLLPSSFDYFGHNLLVSDNLITAVSVFLETQGPVPLSEGGGDSMSRGPSPGQMQG
jgi:hypothetical protein